jgi:hypothetical protein
MKIIFYSLQDTIYGFAKPVDYNDADFVSGNYSASMELKHDTIKVLIPAYCFIDNATWQVKAKDGSIVYYEGTFEQYREET